MHATAAGLEDLRESLAKASPRTRESKAEAYNVSTAALPASGTEQSSAADLACDDAWSLALDSDTANRVLPATWLLARPVASGILVIAVLASAAAYIIVQFSATGKVIDGGFVGLLLSGVFTGFSGLLYIHQRLRQVAVTFFINLDSRYKCKKQPDWLGFRDRSADLELAEHSDQRLEREAEAAEFMRDVFNTTHQLAAGVGVGLVMASLSLLLEPWPEHESVQRAFFVLISAVNVIVGILVASALHVFVWMARVGKHIEVHLFDHSNPASAIYIELCLAWVYFAAAMLSMCLLSLLFSIFDVVGSPLVLVLAIGNMIALASILIIPLVPIWRHLHTQKVALVHRLGKLKQRKFYDAVLALEGDRSAVEEISAQQVSFSQISEELKALDLMTNTLTTIFTLPQGYVVIKAAGTSLVVTAAPYILSSAMKVMKQANGIPA